MRLVASHMKNARLVTMREVGHAPYWEAPAAFNALVLDFLRQARA
jgi:pimeloyl-ACP methyl ester carboxylesterase